MRPLHVLLPFGMLLLASCEPEAPSFQTESGQAREQRGSYGVRIPGNEATREALAAQDSVGKPPPPQNRIAGVPDTCPVHHEKMKVRTVPIVFDKSPLAGDRAASAKDAGGFPFGSEEVVSFRNALLPDEPLSALVYVCDTCVAAKRTAGENRVPPQAPVASQ